MKNEVYINAPMLDAIDLEDIQKSPFATDTELELIEEHELIDESVIHCVFIVLQNIGYNVAYDLIKYTVLAVMKKVREKCKGDENEGTKLVLEVCKKDNTGRLGNRKVITVLTSYKMDEDERERTINKIVGFSLSEDAE